MPLPKLLAHGTKIRALVVDDSVVIRRLVTHALSEDPGIEVVGCAANGVIALQRIPQVNPDVIMLDIEMPEMGGLETLRRIRQSYPSLCVIMFSTLTERGAQVTMEALSLGANDYVAKAAGIGSLDRSMASLRSELVPKIKQFFSFARKPGSETPKPASPPVSRLSNGSRGTLRSILAIGVSTGGPNALAAIVPTLPENFPLPVLVVQHMPPIFTRLLAERLNSQTRLKVEEAAEGSLVEPGKILIAPGDFHMRLRRRANAIAVTLDQGPPENSCRPAVDVLFRSVSEVYGGASIAIVLTGMGQDGLRGVRALRGQGTYVIVQDEASSVVWGMPGFVAKEGLADAVVDLHSVIPEVLKQVRKW